MTVFPRGLEASLYIHVPFCAGKCFYCDFYSVPASPGDAVLEAYTGRLLAGAERLFREFSPAAVPSIYVGGGTPSILGAGGIGRLLGGITALLPGKPGEFTVEANPESLDRPFLESCLRHGVNRISLGLQSFRDASRRAIGRRGAGSAIPGRLALLQELFPGGFSVDLMSGLPHQDGAALLLDIDTALSFFPAHVSLYALALEEGTPLARLAGEGKAALPEADTADDLWLQGRSRLAGAGFEWYEVSNFALPGKRAVHNSRYWRMESWLALGPAASATLIDEEDGTGIRFGFPPDLDAWLGRGGEPGRLPKTEKIGRDTLKKEMILMGFRTLDGLSPALWRRRFGEDIENAAPGTFSSWREKGLMDREKPALTEEGLLLLNRFLAGCFAEMDAVCPAPSAVQPRRPERRR